MSYIAVDAAISEPRHAHAWRDDDGGIHATVRLSASTLYFDSAADARAVAAESSRLPRRWTGSRTGPSRERVG